MTVLSQVVGSMSETTTLCHKRSTDCIRLPHSLHTVELLLFFARCKTVVIYPSGGSFKGTVSRDEYFFWSSKHFNQYFLCMGCADGFQGLSKAFHYLLQLLTFYLLLWRYLLILKMPTEMFLRIPFSVIGRCSLWLQENAQELTSHRRLLVWFYRIVDGFL